MGRRGPPPQPTALKLERGNPGKRALNRQEPVFTPADDTPPADLKGHALARWNELAPDLCRQGLLTVASRFCLRDYCIQEAEIITLERLLARTARRDPIRSTWEKELKSKRVECRQYGAQFGLTPATAAGVKAAKAPTQADPRQLRFFGGGRGPA